MMQISQNRFICWCGQGCRKACYRQLLQLAFEIEQAKHASAAADNTPFQSSFGNIWVMKCGVNSVSSCDTCWATIFNGYPCMLHFFTLHMSILWVKIFIMAWQITWTHARGTPGTWKEAGAIWPKAKGQFGSYPAPTVLSKFPFSAEERMHQNSSQRAAIWMQAHENI